MKNEADTRVLLVEPLLKKANWTSTQIVREYAYTAGTVERIGETFRRGPARKVDMLLRYADTFPLAVVEAKAESQP
ncbi:MAG: DEAD/DEAH box helicase family protein, partial [Bacteroidia bacterium]